MTRSQVFEWARKFGRKNDWNEYERFKGMLPPLSPEEYEQAVKELTDILEV
jgi:hypothetical protein